MIKEIKIYHNSHLVDRSPPLPGGILWNLRSGLWEL